MVLLIGDTECVRAPPTSHSSVNIEFPNEGSIVKVQSGENVSLSTAVNVVCGNESSCSVHFLLTRAGGHHPAEGSVETLPKGHKPIDAGFVGPLATLKRPQSISWAWPGVREGLWILRVFVPNGPAATVRFGVRILSSHRKGLKHAWGPAHECSSSADCGRHYSCVKGACECMSGGFGSDCMAFPASSLQYLPQIDGSPHRGWQAGSWERGAGDAADILNSEYGNCLQVALHVRAFGATAHFLSHVASAAVSIGVGVYILPQHHKPGVVGNHGACKGKGWRCYFAWPPLCGDSHTRQRIGSSGFPMDFLPIPFVDLPPNQFRYTLHQCTE